MQTTLFSIRTPEFIAEVSINEDGIYHTDGQLGYNKADNLPDLIRILMGHGIEIDKHIFL